MLRRIMFFLCVLCLALPFQAEADPLLDAPEEVSQGRAFLVRLTDTAPFDASLNWRGERIPVSSVRLSENIWHFVALLAMPMDAQSPLSLKLRCGQQESSASIRPRPVRWAEQKLKVAPTYVEPPASVRKQIARDSARAKEALASRQPRQDWSLPFVRPVQGTVSSAFGGRRVFNGQPRAPHRGTDLRGAEGVPVLAVASGTVLLAEAQYFSGNVVYVDHGQGVVSTYAHLSAFDVRPGDRVQQGQRLGKVGATGRVTGAHLHIGLNIRGVAVDIMPLFESPLKIVGGPTPEVPRAAPQQHNTSKK